MTRRRAAAAATALIALAVLAVGLGRALDGRGSARARAAPDAAAPLFTAAVARANGGTFSLERQRGHAVLLSFLDTQRQASAGNDPSRAQVVFLKSMDTQSHPYGLRTVIVDTAHADRDALVNFTYDWALAPSIVVVADPRGAIARRYRIATVPTTLLIDRRGLVRRRWNGFVLAAQLDFAIRPLVGRPLVGGGATTTG